MSCLQDQDHEIMERYLRDELGEQEVETFEGHILECEACAGELEKLAALGVELARRRDEIEAPASPGRVSTLVWWAAAAALVLVTGLLIVYQPWMNRDLETLAEIEPPEYQPSRLRGTEDKADDLFRAGMDWYQRGNFKEAATDLQAASIQDPERADAAFFLGASQVLIGSVRSGIESLTVVIAEGDTPYLEEALFLRAQAYLLGSDAEAAATDLESVMELGGDWEARARTQLVELEALSAATR